MFHQTKALFVLLLTYTCSELLTFRLSKIFVCSGNYRSSFKDVVFARKFVPDHMKAIIRGETTSLLSFYILPVKGGFFFDRTRYVINGTNLTKEKMC